MDNTIKKILEETDSNLVEDVFFDTVKNLWVVTYKPPKFQPDEFQSFTDVMEYLNSDT